MRYILAKHQINNLKIQYNRNAGKWQAWTPDKRLLEEFECWRDAVNFVEETHDFLTPLGLRRKYGKIAGD